MIEETNNSPLTINEETIHTIDNPPIEVIEINPVNQSIGELLRTKREEKGLSLKNISHQTKIHIGLLEHLENDELTKLPSKTYVRGFVKSAAKILGINQADAINALETTYNLKTKILKKEIPNFEMRNETARNTLTSMAATPLEAAKHIPYATLFSAFKIIVGVVIIGYIAFNIKKITGRSGDDQIKLPQVFSTVHQKSKNIPKVTAPKIATKAIDSELTPAIPIKINIIQDKNETNQKSELTINDVTLKNISLGDKQFTEDDSIADNKLEEIFPSRYKVRVVKGMENVFVNAVEGDSWITYKVDDKEIKKYVLRQGRSVFIRGETIRLFLGNTKSVKVFYNNKLLSLNTKNVVKNLIFPDEVKTKFMTPLFVFQKDGNVLTSEDYIKTSQKENASLPAQVKLPATTKVKNPAATPLKAKKLPLDIIKNP